MYITDLTELKRVASGRDEENDQFRSWLKDKDDAGTDALVHTITDKVSTAVNCTECGNCCKNLIIEVSPSDLLKTSASMALAPEEFIEKYIETSAKGTYFINTIPCHFLANKKCTIYENRFTECSDFPHLTKPGFRPRLLGTLLHFETCPIIYNVIEEVKTTMGFVY